MKISVHDAFINKNDYKCFCPKCKQKFSPKFPIIKQRKPKAFLVIQDLNEFSSEKYFLTEGVNICGRLSTNTDENSKVQLNVNDRFMSRNHFALEVTFLNSSCTFRIKDLAFDKNKTFVKNTVKNSKSSFELVRNTEFQKIYSGDEIKAGETKMKLFATK